MRFLPYLLALALVATACGESRESEFATDSEGSPAPAQDEATNELELIPEPEAPEYVAPTPLADADEVALTAVFNDAEVSITHGEWFELLDSSAGNEDFVTRILGGFVPEGFGASLLTEMLSSAALRLELDALDSSASAEELVESRSFLVQGLGDRYYADSPDPAAAAEESLDEIAYWQFLAAYGADQGAIERAWVANAGPTDGEPCVSHLLVETEPEAQAALARIESGETFAEVATEVSSDPGSAAQGGSLGCSDPSLFVPEFAAAIESAELNTLVGPVETDFGFHVLIVTDYEVNGITLAVASLTERLQSAEVEVDPLIGEWSSEQITVIPAASGE